MMKVGFHPVRVSSVKPDEYDSQVCMYISIWLEHTLINILHSILHVDLPTIWIQPVFDLAFELESISI